MIILATIYLSQNIFHYFTLDNLLYMGQLSIILSHTHSEVMELEEEIGSYNGRIRSEKNGGKCVVR